MSDLATARDILERLVSFPTVSRDTNIPLVEYVDALLTEHDIAAHRMPNEDGTKQAIFASVGPDVEGGVVLSGHTDVVPVDGHHWATDPWTLTEKDGRLYGRGTCDMKGFDALSLAALIAAKKINLVKPLQVALSFDEEIGCAGAPPLIEAMAGVFPRAGVAIVGEPSMMKVVTGHKGGAGYKVHVHGFEVHSSLMHTGVSAVMEAARLIDWANEMNEANSAVEPTAMAALFTPPWTTLHVGMIEGGTAHNITAKDCRFAIDFRVMPEEEPDDWLARLSKKAADLETRMKITHEAAGITLTPHFGVPALRPEENGAAERLVRRLTGDNGTHVVSYGSEAGHFQNAGMSTVICGPGDIAQAHQPDEWLSVEQFRDGWRFMERLIGALS